MGITPHLTKILFTNRNGGECCWVEIVTGTTDNGTGILANQPLDDYGANQGDLIRYQNGTPKKWAHFAERVKHGRD